MGKLRLISCERSSASGEKGAEEFNLCFAEPDSFIRFHATIYGSIDEKYATGSFTLEELNVEFNQTKK